MNTFATIAEFVLKAQPGDRFERDRSETKARAVDTYVFVERTSDNGGMVDKITTRHYGRPDYPGQRAYCFQTTASQRPVEVDGFFIKESVELLRSASREIASMAARRYSAKGSRQAHAEAMTRYDQAATVAA